MYRLTFIQSRNYVIWHLIVFPFSCSLNSNVPNDHGKGIYEFTLRVNHYVSNCLFAKKVSLKFHLAWPDARLFKRHWIFLNYAFTI